MIYGGSSWAEVPISDFPEQELTGEKYLYELLIDGALSVDLQIQVDKSLETYINQEPTFSVYIDRELSKDLKIDKNQTWNLL